MERFVAQRRPRLTEDEPAMLMSCRDIVEGLFEVHRTDDGADTVVLHNLIDDPSRFDSYTTTELTAGPDAFDPSLDVEFEAEEQQPAAA
ncbi:hypothetical protein OHB49_43560 (plasmid) [Streptomyces sp. NBC_01717]|uniref:hypothetical protein n=1 Tax=Streptomyces sp. NBC_01717 TaxID=2975918 RepID=UPI002E378B71|nr:hypothetical protein [Streptomyces sp. NBC_01717]